MTRPEDRRTLMLEIAQAHAQGARLRPACALAGIDVRTLQRWKTGIPTQGDRRPDVDRPVPSHALTEREKARIIELANEPRFADTPPARIVPTRARWKIENEMFNVLKNKGYNLEHSFGHGKQSLAAILVSLNLLAFAIHTVCDVGDDLWRTARTCTDQARATL
jgi:hypothetical protein